MGLELQRDGCARHLAVDNGQKALLAAGGAVVTVAAIFNSELVLSP